MAGAPFLALCTSFLYEREQLRRGSPLLRLPAS
jgi:hypothetical protein